MPHFRAKTGLEIIQFLDDKMATRQSQGFGLGNKLKWIPNPGQIVGSYH